MTLFDSILIHHKSQEMDIYLMKENSLTADRNLNPLWKSFTRSGEPEWERDDLFLWKSIEKPFARVGLAWWTVKSLIQDSISKIKIDLPALSEPPAKRASSARNRQPDEDTIVSCPECGHQCPHSKIINHLKRCTRKMAPSKKKPVKSKPFEADVTPQIASMSSPNLSDSKRMVKIKTEILNDLAAGIKTEPGEEPSNKSAASGIRVALEKTRGRRFLFFCVLLPFFDRLFSKSFYRYSVAFTSALASSEEDIYVGDKVSKKEKQSHKTDRGEPAPKETKKNPEERNSHNHDGASNQKIKGIKNESLRVQSDKVKRQIQGCSSEKAGNASDSLRVKVKKSEITPAVKETVPALEEVFHLSEGTINLQVPERLIGTWVAFDSSFLPTLNTIFCFRLNKDRKVRIETFIVEFVWFEALLVDFLISIVWHRLNFRLMFYARLLQIKTKMSLCPSTACTSQRADVQEARKACPTKRCLLTRCPRTRRLRTWSP